MDDNSTDMYRLVVITNDDITFDTISSADFGSNVFLNIVNLGSNAIGYGIEEVAQATGGDVYNAISASDLTYQVDEIVYTPEQFIGEDSDGDGIPDIVELYGLKPNGDPIGTDPYNAESDGDTIPDNVELKYLGEQLTSALTLEQYFAAIYCGSDPANPDTDGGWV